MPWRAGFSHALPTRCAQAFVRGKGKGFVLSARRTHVLLEIKTLNWDPSACCSCEILRIHPSCASADTGCIFLQVGGQRHIRGERCPLSQCKGQHSFIDFSCLALLCVLIT